MNNPPGRMAGLLLGLLLAAPGALAEGISNPRIDGNSLKADLALGSASATLTVQFDNVIGLSFENLGLSVESIKPLDAAFLSRLGADASLPAAFPLLIRIEPPASGGLTFSGVVSIEIYTHDLHYAPGSLLRMYSAPSGGAFSDITTSEGSGSYRSGGTKGNFSEFLIATDLRTVQAAVDSKYARLSQLLAGHASKIDGVIQIELSQLHSASFDAWQGEDLVAAIQHVEAFDDKVREHSGDGIPDVWRSTGDLSNVAGELRAAAATLRFSLTQASNAL